MCACVRVCMCVRYRRNVELYRIFYLNNGYTMAMVSDIVGGGVYTYYIGEITSNTNTALELKLYVGGFTLIPASTLYRNTTRGG